MENRQLSKTLRIEDGKLIRDVQDINDIKKVIDILNRKNLLKAKVVDTKVYSEEKKQVQHEILKYIIHSGEYTSSMAYDSTLESINMAIDLYNEGLYAYDLLPHNFTFYNGVWFLFDFDSFKLTKENIITELRGFFKITFSNIEILRILKRKELKQYFLTRYRIEDIIKLIPLHRWLSLFLNMQICLLLRNIGLNKQCLLFIKRLFIKKANYIKKELYTYKSNPNFEYIKNLLNQNNVKNAFCIGEAASNFALYSEDNYQDITKVCYIDDYGICDKFYNTIVNKGIKRIIPAVIYPLVDDKEIRNDINYRALYDQYAKDRFYSDSVILLDFNEIKNNNKDEIINNISDFTSDFLLLSTKDEKEIDFITNKLKTIFNVVETVNNNNEYFIIAKDKKNKNKPILKKEYTDGNRGPDAIRQTWEVYKLIKEKKK